MGAAGGSLAAGLGGALLGFVTFGVGLPVSVGFLAGTLLYSAIAGSKQGSKGEAVRDLLNFTTAAEGAPIAVTFGTQLISGFQMHYRDFRSESRNIGGGSGFGQPKADITTYSVDIAVLLGFGPMSVLRNIYIDKDSIWSGGPIGFTSGEPTTLSTNRGNITFFWGVDEQSFSSYFQAVNSQDFPTASTPPRFNYYSYYVADDFDLNSNPQYPQVVFETTRYPNTPTLPIQPNIGPYDANPACVVWEILSNPIWGCNIPESYLDANAFKAVGEQLQAENFGISFSIDSNSTALSVIQDIQTWTNMFLFTNTSGQISVMLLRENQEFTEDNYILIDDRHLLPGSLTVTNPSVSNLTNQIKAQWTNREKNYIAQHVVLNNAASQQSYGVRFENINLSALTNAENAIAQANRILVSKALPVKTAQFEVNKYTTRPWVGRYIKLQPGSWSDSDAIIMLITQVEETNLASGTVRVSAIEDRLSYMTGTSFGPASEIVDSSSTNVTACLSRFRIYELPTGLNTDDYQVIAVCGQAPNSTARGFHVWAKPAASANLRLIAERYTYVPAGELLQSLSNLGYGYENESANVTVQLDGYNDNRLENVTSSEWHSDFQLMLVGNELISIKNVTSLGSNQYVLTGHRRAVLGSESQSHAIGDEVYFIRPLLNGQNYITSQEFSAGSSWQYTVTPFSNSGEASIESCDLKSFTFSG